MSSRYISALPTSLGPISAQYPHGSFGIIDWLLIDKLRTVPAELCFSSSTQGGNAASSRVYNVTTPQTVTWSSMLPSVRKSIEKSQSEIRVLPYDQWLKLLESSIDNRPNTGGDPDMERRLLQDNPAIKLLHFYKSLGQQTPRPFSTEKAMKASKALENMQAIKPERLAAWTEEWTKDF